MTRILIIDDEESNRFTVREILELNGHDVVEASNGDEGIALQKAEPFDLVITDIVMPKKEGIETIIELRRDYPHLKIIAISGHGSSSFQDLLKKAENSGATGVLAKPFGEEALLKAVNNCLLET